jgi:hypothetical protein
VKIPASSVKDAADNNYAFFRKTFFRFAAILVGLLFIFFGLFRLSQGDLGWTRNELDYDSIFLPMSILGPLLGTCFIYYGVKRRQDG